MLYSVKMRASQWAAHEQGGRHISGAERLVNDIDIEQTVLSMLHRARNHERGSADFINIKVNKLSIAELVVVPALQIMPIVQPSSLRTAHEYATHCLAQAGISKQAIAVAFQQLLSLQQSMRGAMIIEANSGKIINANKYQHGVRVSNMDAQDHNAYKHWLQAHNIQGIHAREAIILASKVAACPVILAELCWSDDPSYTIGYVNDKRHYHRIENLKDYGCDIGGRVFFIKDNCTLDEALEYLHNQPVLIGV